jgi:hypothetical protein
MSRVFCRRTGPAGYAAARTGVSVPSPADEDLRRIVGPQLEHLCEI